MAPQTTYSDTPAVAFAGMVADGCAPDIVTMVNSESSAEIPFGVGVEKNSTTVPRTCKLPNAETDVISGLVVHSHAYARGRQGAQGELGDTGVKPGGVLNILRRGRMWARLDITQATPTIDGRGWIRAVAAGDEVLGAVASADDSTDTVDCTKQIVFRSGPITGADGVLLVLVEVDFTNEPD